MEVAYGGGRDNLSGLRCEVSPTDPCCFSDEMKGARKRPRPVYFNHVHQNRKTSMPINQSTDVSEPKRETLRGFGMGATQHRLGTLSETRWGTVTWSLCPPRLAVMEEGTCSVGREALTHTDPATVQQTRWASACITARTTAN